MKARLAAALAAAAIAVLTGSGGAWATEDGCVGSSDYCATPSPSPSETPDIEVTVTQPDLVIDCPNEQVGVILPTVTGVDWYLDGSGPVTTLDELNAIAIYADGDWSFTVTAVAQPGYTLVGVHEWLYAGTDADTCPEAEPSPTPTSPPVPVPSGAATLPATGGDLGWLLVVSAGLIGGGLTIRRLGHAR